MRFVDLVADGINPNHDGDVPRQSQVISLVHLHFFDFSHLCRVDIMRRFLVLVVGDGVA